MRNHDQKTGDEGTGGGQTDETKGTTEVGVEQQSQGSVPNKTETNVTIHDPDPATQAGAETDDEDED